MAGNAGRLSRKPPGSNRLLLYACMAGYYPFLAVLCAAGGYLAFFFLRIGYQLGGALGFPFFAVGFSFVLMVLDVILALPALFIGGNRRDPLEIELPRKWMTGLHALVEKVARKRHVDPPDEVRLHADTVAHVYEDERGQRILVVGGAAVAAFSQEALAGIIAHELGHFAGGDTRLSRIGMKWHRVMAVLEYRVHMHRWSLLNPLAWLVRLYHFVFGLLWAANQRAEEYAADSHDVAVAGADVAASGLILFTVSEIMPWVRLSSIAEACVAAREPMNSIFAEQARRARAASPSEWKDACRKALKQKTGLFDTHPCLKERLKAIGVSPRKALDMAVPSAEPPARALFANWELVEKLLTEKIMAIYREVHQHKMELAQIFARH
ncbi:MAG TPA: M48 family metalloprotease [Gemmataceae bacterium]|nr:M48 family metalloprotease [Gemmataceae bacterium]